MSFKGNFLFQSNLSSPNPVVKWFHLNLERHLDTSLHLWFWNYFPGKSSLKSFYSLQVLITWSRVMAPSSLRSLKARFLKEKIKRDG